jgi:hypothetical protein
MMKGLVRKVRARSVECREEGVGRSRTGAHTTRSSREEGAILILALAYLVSVSLVVAMLSTWATGDLNNTSHFTSASSLTLAATDMTDAAIQYVRYNPQISSTQAPGHASPVVPCWGGVSIKDIPVINGDQIAVWCSTVWNPLSYQTRKVTFDACPITVSAPACQGSNATLTAVVVYDDYPPAPTKSAPIQTLCTLWCGSGVTISSWQWGSSTPGSVTGVASTMTFTNEPSDTSAGSDTEAAVTVVDASDNPVAGDTVTLSQLSGPSPGVGTITAVTNTAGVAEFTSIDPQTPGSYTLSAVDGAANATSSSFVVSTQRSVITTSTAPTNATVNGTKYAVSATATSGDTVVITSATTTVCTLSGGLVSFIANGTCTLDFNDPATGNLNYSPALEVTQSFPVGGLAATQVAIALSTKTPAASSTTNVTMTLTLENAVGAPINSSGTTTVVLSDIGNGFFSLSKGATGTGSLNVNFTNGVGTETAYFGNENAGQDTISAINGTTNWGNATLTTQGGAATQVTISPSTSSPTVSSVTNTSLTFQLEDQWGNAAVSSGTTTLVLSDSGNGFFANSKGVSGTSTLSVTIAGGVGTATAYFGNEGSGSDVITAMNGASAWGTSTVTLAAGAASAIQITLSPTPVGKSGSTNTAVTLQLVDQFGNHVATSGVSITLTNSGSGFFAASSGVSSGSKNAGTSMSFSTNGSGVATGYFGDDTGQSDTITATPPTGSGIAVATTTFTV